MEFQIVLIRNYFNQAKDVKVNMFMQDILNIKKAGYFSKHRNSFLPVSGEDFFCFHVLICNKENLDPILCYKVVSYKSCLYYRYPFHIKEIIESKYSDEDKEVILSILEERIKEGKDLSYSGGWTVNPKYRGLNLTSILKDIYTGTHYLLHQDFEISTMTGFGAVKMGTYDFFKKDWGVISPVDRTILIEFADSLDCRFMYGDIDKLSLKKYQMAKKYGDLWANKISYVVADNYREEDDEIPSLLNMA